MCFCEVASGREMNGAFEGLPDEKAQGKAFVQMDEAHIPVSALMNSRCVFLTLCSSIRPQQGPSHKRGTRK